MLLVHWEYLFCACIDALLAEKHMRLGLEWNVCTYLFSLVESLKWQESNTKDTGSKYDFKLEIEK